MWGGRGGRGGRGACACGGGGGGGGGWVGGWGGGGMILGEVKARPKDIISFSLDYISKSKVQTSNPSSSPKPLDTPARPADCSTCDGNDITVACMDCLGMVFHKMVRNSIEREPKSMMIFLIGHVNG